MPQITEHITIRIAKEFDDAPGARNIDEGSCSGEEFLNNALLPAYERAKQQGYNLLIDLDDTEGYATSFLEEAFGGLARKFGPKEILQILEFKSDDEPLLIEEIKSYIIEANNSR